MGDVNSRLAPNFTQSFFSGLQFLPPTSMKMHIPLLTFSTSQTSCPQTSFRPSLPCVPVHRGSLSLTRRLSQTLLHRRLPPWTLMLFLAMSFAVRSIAPCFVLSAHIPPLSFRGTIAASSNRLLFASPPFVLPAVHHHHHQNWTFFFRLLNSHSKVSCWCNPIFLFHHQMLLCHSQYTLRVPALINTLFRTPTRPVGVSILPTGILTFSVPLVLFLFSLKVPTTLPNCRLHLRPALSSFPFLLFQLIFISILIPSMSLISYREQPCHPLTFSLPLFFLTISLTSLLLPPSISTSLNLIPDSPVMSEPISMLATVSLVALPSDDSPLFHLPPSTHCHFYPLVFPTPTLLPNSLLPPLLLPLTQFFPKSFNKLENPISPIPHYNFLNSDIPCLNPTDEQLGCQ